MSISSLLSAVATELEARRRPASTSPTLSPQGNHRDTAHRNSNPLLTTRTMSHPIILTTTTTTTSTTTASTATAATPATPSNNPSSTTMQLNASSSSAATSTAAAATAALSSSSSSSLYPWPSQAMEGADFTAEVADSNAEMSEDNEEDEDDMDDSDSSGDYGQKPSTLNCVPNRLVKASRRLSMTMASSPSSSSSARSPKPRLGSRPKSNSFKDLSPASSEEGLGFTHQCGVAGCTATFQSQEHLKRHMRKHTGEKPFACLFPGCQKTFSRNDNMLQHLRTHAKVVKGKMAKGPTGKLVPSSIALAIRENMLNNSSPPSPTTITPLSSAAIPAVRRLSRTGSSHSLRSRSRSQSPKSHPPASQPPSQPSVEKPSSPPEVPRSSPPHHPSVAPLSGAPHSHCTSLDAEMEIPKQGPISPPILPCISSFESMLLGTQFQSKEPQSFRRMIPYNELAGSSDTCRRQSVSDIDRAVLDKLKGPL